MYNTKILAQKNYFILRFFITIILLFPINSNAQSIDSLYRVLKQQTGIDRIATLQSLSEEALIVSNDSSIVYAKKAFEYAKHINDEKSQITSALLLGEIYNKQFQDSLSLFFISQSLDLAKNIKNDSLISLSYIRMAKHYTHTNQPRKSIDRLKLSLTYSNENNFKQLIAVAHKETGYAWFSMGAFDKALNEYIVTLKLYEELQDQFNLALIYNLIGNIYLKTHDQDLSIEYFKRALTINTAINNIDGMCSNTINIGAANTRAGNYEEALIYYRQALPITKEIKNQRFEAITTGNIGSNLVLLGRFEEGLKYLYDALALKEKIQSHRSILHTLNDIADVKIKMKDGIGAKQAAEKIVKLATEYEEADMLRYGYLNLSNSYKVLGEFENANTYLEKYIDLKDSLFGVEKDKQLKQLQIQYDTEKKDHAIVALEKEKQLARAERNSYFLAGFIIMLLLIALYMNQRIRTKRKNQLLEKEREVDKLKTNFFANISHEFRTPLSLILGPLESMMNQVKEPSQSYQLGLMKKSASRLLRLINQILDLSKLESGKLELKVRKVNAVDLVSSLTSTFESVASTNDIGLEMECEEKEIWVYCDQEHVETICINLITNAFKFSKPEDRVRVRLDKISVNTNRYTEGYLQLKVQDTGIGLSDEQIANIFDRFYQAGSSSINHFGGTGIGLALTKELVDLHAGEIIVEGAVGEGVTVTVDLPLGKKHLSEEQIILDETSIETTRDLQNAALLETVKPEFTDQGSEDHEKSMVLIIEDNVDVRNFIISILSEKYNIITAGNGEEGIDQGKAFIPDLIISDVMMPKMNGYEACRALKEDQKTSHIPIILLTAKTSLSSRLEGLETEADLYLSKPFAPKELKLCIQNLIQSRRKLREKYNREVILIPSEIAVNSIDEQFLEKLMTILEENYKDESFSVEELSRKAGMSRSQLHRKLYALTNDSSSQFIRSFRLQRAMSLLKKKHATISEISYMVGFSSHSYFNKCFMKQYDCTPSSIIESTINIETSA